MMAFSGFAFVLMEDPRDAEDAARGLDGSRICGRRVKVSDRHLFVLFTIMLKDRKLHSS
jgi:hypothetical protein